MGRLDGKVALVTGGAKGLGEADARCMAAEGAQVIVADMDTEAGQAVVKDIGKSAVFKQLDVANEEAWADVMSDVERDYGKLNVLVNNAGIVEPGNIETQTTDDYRKVLAVSLDGAYFGCKYAMPLMKKSGMCSIINMASIASLQGEPYVLAYSAAKGAVEALSRSIAAHCALSKYTIRCNSVHPSGIVTPMVMSIEQKVLDAGLISLEDQDAASKLSKLGEPNDIGHTVVFLASDESKFINGAAIRVDNAMSIVCGVVPE
ncbi:MAG: SDR family oxidoreductase [Pseudomonadota bacterium]